MMALDPTKKFGNKPLRESACVDLSKQNELIDVTFKERQQPQKITVIFFPFFGEGVGAKKIDKIIIDLT